MTQVQVSICINTVAGLPQLEMVTVLTELMRKISVPEASDLARSGSPSVVPERIAIVGTGPRGISVIERVAKKLTGKVTQRPLAIYAIDAVEIGCGRIWRTDQPDWFIMNTRCKNATMFSPPLTGSVTSADDQLTFMEWWKRMDPQFPGPSGFAPRVLYGKYLKYVLDIIELRLPKFISLNRILDRISDITPVSDGYNLTFASGRDDLRVDRLVICSGYSEQEEDMPAIAQDSSSTAHITAFDILDTLHSGFMLPSDLSDKVVGIKGLGLTFYDVLSELTTGRGGKYVHASNGLRYLPSGKEPKKILAGSRSGYPLPVRGRDDRPKGMRYAPQIFTKERVIEMRQKGPACFRTSYLPWITAEVNLVYLEKTLGPVSFGLLRERFEQIDLRTETVLPSLTELARDFGVDCLLDLEALVTPFKDATFDDQVEFRQAVMAVVADDVARAEVGEFTDPIKASLDVLRHIRPIIRMAVDLGGLTRESHHEFIGKIGPKVAFLSTGPSLFRGKQLMALVKAGVVDILGPSVSFDGGDGSKVVASSPVVKSYKCQIDVLIDAFVAAPDVDRDGNPVIRSLGDAGILRNFMGAGGVEVTPKPFHPVSRDGQISDRMHVLGIPTESARWFLHVGLIEPGVWDEFVDDAEAIAAKLTDHLVVDRAEITPTELEFSSEGQTELGKYLT